MAEQAYRDLAQRLDTIPSGFPPTESGVELELLARLFTPEEAAVASVMRLTPETADRIAVRAGMDPIATRKLLDGMASRRRIRAQHDQGQCTFRLVPRVYGVLGIASRKQFAKKAMPDFQFVVADFASIICL